jgi:ABC-2 type transport system ATP-binding protein
MTDDARGTQAVAELRGVHKRYGKAEALGGIDLEIQPGELLALLGPNGAGKTTAVSILLGQRRPDAGSARLFGRDPTLPAARRPVGVTLQESRFPDNLTVREMVDLVRIHYPHPAATPAMLVPLLVRFALFSGFGSRGRGGPRPDRRATCGLPRGLSTPA